MTYLKRQLNKLFSNITETRPLVYLNGPRQVGKSTLAENIKTKKEINFVSFDSPLSLLAAKSDPVAFIASQPRDALNIIDEVQKVPEVFSQLKVAIDNARKSGRNESLYVLTGSTNIMAIPRLAKELVGRMSILTLLAFSSSEYEQTDKNFIESLWNDELSYKKYKDADLLDIISNSTFPEIMIHHKIDRIKWFDDYLTTILQRDILILEDIKNPESIIQLLVSLTQRVGSLLNNANVMKEVGLDAKTYNKYKTLTKNTFIITEIEPWSKPNNLNKHFVKSSKIYFNDTNLLCYLMRKDLSEMYKDDLTVFGHIFENFIVTEILKNIKCLTGINVSHFNLSNGKEVDFVLENAKGETIGIEVKLYKTLTSKDFTNMKLLHQVSGEKFKKGIVVYTGNELVPFGGNMWAVPVNYLWE
ncbi:MAG: ATP-binding protein [Endomicrobium sp.]|jgi:predicted AAA+ superfamily ATPase|nr:ATP-binding protein [Endomicrobium sp.]